MRSVPVPTTPTQRAAVETGLAALYAWVAWVLLWLLISSQDWGVQGPNTSWETFRPYLFAVAAGAVLVAVWAIPTLVVGLLLRRRSATTRSLAAAAVAVALVLAPAVGLVSTAAEQSGGSGWRLVLFLTVTGPLAAFACYGTAAATTTLAATRASQTPPGARHSRHE